MEQVGRGTAMVRQAQGRHERVKEILSVDMSTVMELIAAANEAAGDLDALRIPADDRSKSTLQGELGRNLNRLADMLAAASAEAKMEYWRLKGFEDPRD